jgi:hypothetical protein
MFLYRVSGIVCAGVALFCAFAAANGAPPVAAAVCILFFSTLACVQLSGASYTYERRLVG